MKKLLFVILLALSACDLPHGTGTGNPIMPSSGSSNLVSGKIFFSLCKMMEKCYPAISDEICFNGIVNLTGFAPKLGLTSIPSPTAQEIMSAEATNQIIPNEDAGAHCQAQMLKWSCTDPKIINAYQPGAAIPLAETVELLDPVCAGTFTQ